MSTAEEYIRATDEASDYADKQVEDIEQEAVEAIDALYRGDNRDRKLWQAMGVDYRLTIEDYDRAEPDDRDLDWSLGVAGIAGASLADFWIVARDETLIKPAAYKEQLVGSLEMSQAELVKAGKRGFDILGDVSYERLRAEYVEQFKYLTELDNLELYQLLVRNGGVRSPDKIINDAMGYVSRMTSYRPGSTQFMESVNNLISSSSKRGIKSMTRRSVQQIYTDSEVAGDMNRLMVWIVEYSKNTCGYCLDNAGQVMPYSQWVIDGLPGADVCLGGDLCNCFLAAV